MEHIILLVHILAAVGVIGLILIQQGKGSEVGASFGAGASQTIFGSQGTGNFLTRATAVLVTIFFATCLGLGYLNTAHLRPKDLDTLIDKVQKSEFQDVPTTNPASESNTTPSNIEKSSSNSSLDIPKVPD